MQTQELQPQNFKTQEQRFRFTGKGSEYFRIWIVNLILSILTLGIYSAWAKVRRMQYFFRNTRLLDAGFDYHGTPLAILKGRLIGLGLFAAYYTSLKFEPLLGLAIGLGLALLMPVLLVFSLRFRLYNSSYRGLRFGFSGSIGEAYVAFLLLPIISLFTLYLLAPFTHQYIKAYQQNNSRFGQSTFTFNAGAGGFYLVYFISLMQLLLIAGLFGYGAYRMFGEGMGNTPKEQLIVTIFVAVYALMILATLFIVPYFISRIQNLVWNHTELGAHRFSSDLRVSGLAWVMVSNLILIVLTLGLFKPFADIRMMRYRIEHLALLPGGDIDEFIASAQPQAGAAGTETAELFDIDIGF